MLIAQLGYIGFESFVENENGVIAYIQKKDWNSNKVEDLYLLNSNEFDITFKYNESKSLSLTYFGDGAANQGQVYESYNMAALWKLPVIFCIENNQYGMGTSTKRASAGNDLSKHGESFGIPGFAVDGMNPISVYLAGLKAVKWVREGNGPIIMEMKTYRYRGHSMSDPAKYRTREEVQKMREEQDPIEYIKNQLLTKKILNEDDLSKIDSNIRLEISELAEKATKAEVPKEEELYNNVLSS